MADGYSDIIIVLSYSNFKISGVYKLRLFLPDFFLKQEKSAISNFRAILLNDDQGVKKKNCVTY